jgi:hypothetical protein
MSIAFAQTCTFPFATEWQSISYWKGAENKPFSIRIISVYAVKDGRIIDDSTYYDRKAP